MLQPTGPLPPEIYWRRRMLAIGVLVVALTVLMWFVLSLRGGGDSPKSTPAAASTPVAAGTSTATTTSTASASSSAESSSTATSSAPATTTSSAAATPVAQPGPPAPPGQCPDQSLAVKVSVEQPTYTAGTEPKFGVVITNISTGPCSRDVGAGQQQVLVYSMDGQQRLWASTDCFRDPADVRNFNPGQQAGFVIQWSAKTSQPGCSGNREAVKPGAYTVVAQLGGLRSAPEPFNIA